MGTSQAGQGGLGIKQQLRGTWTMDTDGHRYAAELLKILKYYFFPLHVVLILNTVLFFTARKSF